jgi:hypothetical protein
VVSDYGLQILQNFEEIVIIFIEYLDSYFSGTKFDETLMNVLKSVIIEQMGSGSSSMDGWYPSLFYNRDEESVMFKPEVSTMFTGVSDLRDDGGIVHLGNGSIQLMYVLTTNNVTNERTVYLSPVYTTYEFVTDVNARLNDEEWSKSYQSYEPLNFNTE